MEVFPLFASPVCKMMVEENINELMKYVNEESYSVEYNHSSRRSQGSNDKRVLEKYSRIKKLILKYFHKFSSEFLRYDGNFNITTSWFTKSQKNSSSQFHLHKNSFYSGVLYFGEYDDNNGGQLQFNNPLIPFSDYRIIPKSYFIGNCGEYSISPAKNLLVLFPSYLSHRITHYKGNNIRYSLAFNISPIGKYGGGDSSYNTEWF